MTKNIWIISEYIDTPYNGYMVRHFYMGKEFLQLGYNVTIITSNFTHTRINNLVVNDLYKIELIDNIKYLWIKTCKYKNSHDKKRILNWLIFTYRLFFNLPIYKLEKPDFIIVSSPSIFPFLPAYIWAKKYNAKIFFEVRDIWPLSIVEIGNINKFHPFIKIMELIEKFIYSKADKIITLLPYFNNYLKEIGFFNKKAVYIPNGMPHKLFKENEKIPDPILNQIPKNKFIVMYAGSFTKGKALYSLIKAAYILKEYNNIYFILLGKGGGEKKLKDLTNTMKLNNINFITPISKTQIQKVLKLVDVCYLSFKKISVFKYGISPNKIFDYMYAKKPILNSFSGKGDLVNLAKCGITVEAENPKILAKGILKFYTTKKSEMLKLGKNGKNFLMKNHLFEKLALRYIEKCFYD